MQLVRVAQAPVSFQRRAKTYPARLQAVALHSVRLPCMRALRRSSHEPAVDAVYVSKLQLPAMSVWHAPTAVIEISYLKAHGVEMHDVPGTEREVTREHHKL